MSCDFTRFAAAGVQTLKPYEPGKSIEELERELGLQQAIKLASNENPLGPSPRAVDAVREHVIHAARYPDGNGSKLKQKLAQRHGVAEACITLGNGSNDILELIARVFLTSDTAAIFSQHAFAVYPIVTQAVGATARVAAANPPDHGMPFGHDLNAMTSMLDDTTRVVFIANPNNPTGTWLTEKSLQSFIKSIPETVLIVVDEAYWDYVREPEYPNAIDWLEQFPNLIVTRTFSKIYGLAGVRLGFGISHPEVANLLNRVRQPFNVNSLAQKAALAALDDEDHVHRSQMVNAKGLRQLAVACSERGLSFIPSVGNFVCIDVGQPAMRVYQLLLQRGIIVRPVENYGFPNHLRVTVGTHEQNRSVIEALDRVLLEA